MAGVGVPKSRLKQFGFRVKRELFRYRKELERLPAPYRLVGALLYGCGLPLSECLELRIHCFNLDSGLLTVHDGKGQKDRTVPLPARMMPEIREQIEAVRRVHEDLAVGYAGVFLPRQLDTKYRNAAREFIWQWFFPAATLTSVPGSGEKVAVSSA
jgi:integrase